jgi:hypothetical protein
MGEPESVYEDIDRFCRLQCAYGPAEAECLDCVLLEHRSLNEKERYNLFGPAGEEG